MPGNNVQNLVGPSMTAGVNFLSGTATSAFQLVSSLAQAPINEINKINGQAQMIVNMAKNGVFGMASNAGALVGSAAGSAMGIGGSVLGAISNLSDIGINAVNDINNYAIGKVDVLRDKITPDPNRVTYWLSYFTSYYHDYLLEKYMKEDNFTKEEIAEQELERSKQKSLDDYLMIAEGAVQDANKCMQDVTEKVNEFSKKIQDYVLAGPNMLTGWINDQMARVYTGIDDYFDKKVYPKVEKAKENSSKWIGKQLGQSAGATWAWSEYNLYRKAKMEAARKKKEAESAAKEKLITAKNQLAGMNGL